MREFIEESNDDGITFGNARGVRNIFEQILTEQANRLAALSEFTKDDLMTISVEDVYHARDMEYDAPMTVPEEPSEAPEEPAEPSEAPEEAPPADQDEPADKE